MKNFIFCLLLYFQWIQFIHAIPLIWKQKINDSEKNVETNYVVQDHHLIKNTTAIVLHKQTARELFSLLLLSSGHIPTSQNIMIKFFQMKISIEKKFIYYQEQSL